MKKCSKSRKAMFFLKIEISDESDIFGPKIQYPMCSKQPKNVKNALFVTPPAGEGHINIFFLNSWDRSIRKYIVFVFECLFLYVAFLLRFMFSFSYMFRLFYLLFLCCVLRLVLFCLLLLVCLIYVLVCVLLFSYLVCFYRF